MPSLPLPASSLNPNLIYLGRLLGLLSGSGTDSVSLETGWFKDPWSNVKNAPNDPADLLDLLGGDGKSTGLLGTASKDFGNLLVQPGTTTPATTTWFPIKLPAKKGQDPQPTGAYVVLPKDHSQKSAVVGLGMAKKITTTDKIEITPFIYFPIFLFPPNGTPIVTGNAANPVLVGVTIKNPTPFQAGPITFDGVQLLTSIYFDGTKPSFALYFTNKDAKVGLFQTVDQIVQGGAAPWINQVLATATVNGWLTSAIGETKLTTGEILTVIKLLTAPAGTGKPYTVADLGAFAAQTAEDIFFDVLDAIAADGKPIIQIGDASVYVVKADSDADGSDYGLRLEMPDVAMGQDAADSEATSGTTEAQDDDAASPDTGPNRQLTLQLGKYLTGQDKNEDAWIQSAYPDWTPTDPGIALYLLNKAKDDTLSFHPRLSLISIGFDYAGAADKQLVSTGAFAMKGVEGRIFIDLDFETPANNIYGGIFRCDSLAPPIGASFNSPGGNNAVAENLIASGDDSPGGGAAEGEKDSVNPAFSMSAAYVSAGKFHFQLYDDNLQPADKVSLSIQRSFGPLTCDRIGIGWDEAQYLLSLYFDGSISLSVLQVGLTELSIGIPVTNPTDLQSYALDLQGLDVSFNTGPVSITGGLLKTTNDDGTIEYDGQAFIKLETFSIGAIGSYATLEGGGTSLFIFAFLAEPLGGPPAFFVTGLAGGFGYNRALIAPTADKVMDFPLIAGVSNPAALNITPGEAPDLSKVLSSLKDTVPPTRGENWLAAGVQFTSFNIINSNVLLIAKFGQEFEILILGLSTLKLPQQGTTYAYVELGLVVTIRPDEGEIGAMALVTSNSYVIDPACKLTGGFAFFVWFGDNPHAGDFVLTIGGYHAAFVVPDWYPTVPRLGFNWPVSGDVTIKGEAYFALTPSCVMAGGSLEILYSSGNLQAWFTAHADFLISWKPFFYVISIGVSIGVSYRVKILFVDTTIRVEIGADVDIWGPPTGGRVDVHLWIVSFTVSFGSDRSEVQTTIDWNGFKTMLPSAPASKTLARRRRLAKQLPGDTPADVVITSITPSNGLLQTLDDGTWVVRPSSFTFSVSSTVPATSTKLNGTSNTPALPTDYFVGIRPMAVAAITSEISVTITGDVDAKWVCEVDQRDVPEAMWGKPVPAGSTPPPAANLLPDRLVGLKLVTTDPNPMFGPPQIDIEQAFTDIIVAAATLPLSQSPTPTGGVPDPDPTPPSLVDVGHVMDTDLATKRADLFAAIGLVGVNAGTSGSLATLAGDPYRAFQDSPMVGSPVGS
jgi:hypothetical protein